MQLFHHPDTIDIIMWRQVSDITILWRQRSDIRYVCQSQANQIAAFHLLGQQVLLSRTQNLNISNGPSVIVCVRAYCMYVCVSVWLSAVESRWEGLGRCCWIANNSIRLHCGVRLCISCVRVHRFTHARAVYNLSVPLLSRGPYKVWD